MYLSSLTVKNFRCFDENGSSILFNPGLTVLVGENDSGKSAIIDAIRIVLGTTDLAWIHLNSDDFYNNDIERQIEICCKFSDLTLDEKGAFLENLSYEENSNGVVMENLYLHWNGKYVNTFKPARFISSLSTGKDGKGVAPSAEAKELLRATYLKPLRDAYSDMQSGRHSRLSQIVQNISSLNEGENSYQEGMDLKQLSLIGIVNLSNTLLETHRAIQEVNKNLSRIVGDEMLLKNDVIHTKFQVAGSQNTDVQKLLSLLEKLDLSVDTAESTLNGKFGLGTSNILSMACELLLNSENNKKGMSSFLLIEEPEAHVHAQRQIKMIQSLETETAGSRQQIILTTHSPLIASVVKLENLVIIKRGKAFPLNKGYTKLEEDDYQYLEKYLDATKANLFFARSVIIVEGPGEALLFPTLSKLMNCSFADYGTSLVDVRSTGLRRFARILQRSDESESLNVKVACVTDRDIMPSCAPYYCINEKYTTSDTWPKIEDRNWKAEDDFSAEGAEKYLQKIHEKADGQNTKTFVSDQWTLEYDLAYYGLSHEKMREALIESLVKTHYAESTRDKQKLDLQEKLDEFDSDEKKASYFYSYFSRKNTSKADFAQILSIELEKHFLGKETELEKSLPPYIVSAIRYVSGD